MPQEVYEAVVSRGVDIPGDPPFDLHHCIVTKNDVRALPNEEYAKIHDRRNLLVMPHADHTSHANIPSREDAIKIMLQHYAYEDLLAFYENINFKIKPFRFPPKEDVVTFIHIGVEEDLGRTLHAALRKYGDSKITSLMYNLIELVGEEPWTAYLDAIWAALQKEKPNSVTALTEAVRNAILDDVDWEQKLERMVLRLTFQLFDEDAWQCFISLMVDWEQEYKERTDDSEV